VQPVEKLYCRALLRRKTVENSLIWDLFAVIWWQNMAVRILKNSSVDFFNRLVGLMRQKGVFSQGFLELQDHF
jgi:hypothetical protein